MTDQQPHKDSVEAAAKIYKIACWRQCFESPPPEYCPENFAAIIESVRQKAWNDGHEAGMDAEAMVNIQRKQQ